MMTRPSDAALLRYVSGESSLAESQAIEQWLATDPDLAASVAELQRAWSAVAPSAPHFDKAAVWHRIAAETRPNRLAASPHRRITPYAIAAALVLAVGITLYQTYPKHQADPEITWRDVTTARAQQAVLDLADGSRVTLAAESRLRIPSNFNVKTRLGKRRELHLEGRAHFQVTHDSTRPFLVHTATATTEDIGTAFVITAYPESRATHVVVAEGSVAMRQPATPKPLITLTRGDVATLDASGTATISRNADVERYLSWTKGILTLDGVRLRDAIPEMERWYDVEIRLADQTLGNRRVTAELRSEPASRATERLSLILGVRAQSAGRVITLSR